MSGAPDVERELQPRGRREHAEGERRDRLHEVAHDIGGRDHRRPGGAPERSIVTSPSPPENIRL